ncbi:hypothetical protein K474DRAFT_1588173, partial [Panus rudis PR-1116 ss-1]
LQAVLLLRPNVPLYSTDAMPINCSANESAVSESLPAASTSQAPVRTCECLTQTLYCHGCGTGIGYMIVSPCQRCTTSVTVTNRATNGHRFVFYSGEIVASERHYVPGERGINAAVVTGTVHPVTESPSHSRMVSGETVSDAPSSPPPLEYVDDILSAMPSSFSFSDITSSPSSYQGPSAPSSPRAVSYHPAAMNASPQSPASPVLERPVVPNGQIGYQFEVLKAGDVLYWHHLVRSGENPAVTEDSRARGPGSNAKALLSGTQTLVNPCRGRIVAGR